MPDDRLLAAEVDDSEFVRSRSRPFRVHAVKRETDDRSIDPDSDILPLVMNLAQNMPCETLGLVHGSGSMASA